MRNSKKDMSSEVLNAKIRDRGRAVLGRFSEVTKLGVADRGLISMIEEVVTYWPSLLRPALTSFCCEAVGGESSLIIDAGVVLNLFDAGLSIHDDIIDKTLKKRFRMTILGSRGLENSVLLGDLFIVKAWSLICKMMDKNNYSTISSFGKLYENFFIEMCEGEIAEISCRMNFDTSLEVYQQILMQINSGLRACAHLGGLLGGATKKQVMILSEFGKSLSLMFGLKDDLIDSLNIEGYLLHRIRNESVPFPLLFAAKSPENLSEIRSIINNPSIASFDVQKLSKICLEAKAFIHLAKVVNEEAQKAHCLLNSLEPTSAREILRSLVNDTNKLVLNLSS